MSLYLLDTNICIFLLNQRVGFEKIVQHMDGLERRQVGISAVTVAELEFGPLPANDRGITSNVWSGFWRISKCFPSTGTQLALTARYVLPYKHKEHPSVPWIS